MVNTNLSKSSRDWGIIQKRNSDGSLAWYARITRLDGNGKKKQFTAKADNKSHARRLREELKARFDDRGERALEGVRMRFRDLAEIYEDRKLFAAEYHGTGKARRKVAGVRSLKPSQHYLKLLKGFFGSHLIKEIAHSDIEDFKAKRLKTPSIRGERSIADVNRSLELLRGILRFSVRNGWLAKSPFDMGSPLISKADENNRERVLSFEEEMRLLRCCTDERPMSYLRKGRLVNALRKGGRGYLKALIVTAADTAMRKGELLKLKWKEVDFDSRMITVVAMNSKTARERKIGMTVRVVEELQTLWKKGLLDQDSLVFGVKDNFQNGFTKVKEEAGIEDFHFHDLRHTAITRMVASGMPPLEIMKVTDHSQWKTFSRYVNPNKESIIQIAEALSRYNTSAASLNYTDQPFEN
jgi:integrase